MGKKVINNIRIILEVILAVIIVGGGFYTHGKLVQTVENEKEQRCILSSRLEAVIQANNELKNAIVALTLEIQHIKDDLKERN